MNHMFILSAPMIQSLKRNKTHLVLPHLYGNKEYLESYRKFADAGEYLLQDNSIFELKNVVGGDLLDFGRQIKATCIMIPEVLRDFKASQAAAMDFFGDTALQALSSDEFKFAAAVQGKSYAEIKEHYAWLSVHPFIDTIAIPFNFEFDAYGDVSEEKKQAGWNRFSVVERLMVDRVWNSAKKHHLLGLYNPAELALYHPRRDWISRLDFSSIVSNDSSSAYWHSLYGVKYFESGLLYKKIESHVDFESKFNHREQHDCFHWNAAMIEEYLTGENANQLEDQYIIWMEEAKA